jgi:hypothetical protein
MLTFFLFSIKDKLLVEGVKKVGRNWREIVDTNFPNRTALASKNRYALLQRRRQSGAPGANDGNPVTALSMKPAASASAVANNDSSSQGFDTDFESALADWTDDGCVEFAESTVASSSTACLFGGLESRDGPDTGSLHGSRLASYIFRWTYRSSVTHARPQHVNEFERYAMLSFLSFSWLS